MRLWTGGGRGCSKTIDVLLMMIFIGTLFCNLLEDSMRLHLQPSWVGYPSRRPKGCGVQSPLGPKVYPTATFKSRSLESSQTQSTGERALMRACFSQLLRNRSAKGERRNCSVIYQLLTVQEWSGGTSSGPQAVEWSGFHCLL